jgi:hypothetical protein
MEETGQARSRRLLSGKSAGLFGGFAAVASSVVVVMGLVSIPAASAAPYRTHAVHGSVAKANVVSPHTPVDIAAPLNLVYGEAYVGDAAPVIYSQTPTQPTYVHGIVGYVLTAGSLSTAFQFTSPTPFVAGQSYELDGSAGDSRVGLTTCGSTGSVNDITVDQLVLDGSGNVTTLAVQFDCVDSNGINEVLGTIAFNASPSTPGQGYYLYGAAGELGGFGNDEFLNYLGDLTTTNLNQPIVGMATTPSGGGYWMVATDGGVFSYGDANFYGSTGNIHLNKPIVGMAATPDGKGYWMVASDGGIFSFGDANFYGSTGNIHLNKPIVGMASTPDGHGYWLVASDGGIFTFGDAPFYGSTGNIRLNSPIVGMTPTPDGHGYWFTASDGGVFSYGDAQFAGSLGGLGIDDVVGMAR